MSDVDEYDAYDIPPEFHAFVAAEAAATIADRERAQAQPAPAPQSPAHTAPSSAVDEFDIYDFSEFTADDFARIDAHVLASHVPVAASDDRPPAGGPRLAIALEGPADCSHLVKETARPASPPQPPRPADKSPYERFRGKRQFLSVSDLVGPAWCEVQFDYGLRQKRSKALKDRPKTFVTQKGTVISVDQEVAFVNNKTSTRGQSIHKTLERELRPEIIEVQPTLPEEYWALRLLNMISSIDVLIEEGRCREIPVFGIVHDQLVIGIIDELARLPIPVPEPPTRETPSKQRRSPNKRGSPSTPSKSKSKKSRRSPSPSQTQLLAFFSNSSQLSRADTETQPAPSTPRMSSVPLPEDTDPDLPLVQRAEECPRFRLHMSDTKTRRTGSMPSEEDTLQARLQLMLYHRLLNRLLTAPFDFHALWTRTGVDASRAFSDAFIAQAGLRLPDSLGTGGIYCLRDLAALWVHAAEALAVDGVDATLTIVYRAQRQRWDAPLFESPSVSRSPSKTKSPSPAKRSRRRVGKREKAEAACSDQEAQDIARAIEASLNETPAAYDGGDDAFARAIAESLKEAVVTDVVPVTATAIDEEPVSPPAQQPEAGAEAVHVPESLSGDTDQTFDPLPLPARPPSAARTDTEDDTGSDEELTLAQLEEHAGIIGTKAFAVDDALLDGYLRSVLKWWHGARAPRGVDMESTWRCQSCEYRDGCEWREEKAREASAASRRKTAVRT